MSVNLGGELLIDSGNLPPEILIEILIWVPVKSLVCFTSVSKSWYALITSPSFIKKQLNRIQHQNHWAARMLLRRYTHDDRKEHYSLHPDDEVVSEEDDNGGDSFSLKSTELVFPFRSLNGYFRVVGTCNGLVCSSDDLFGIPKTITLWNPLIRKYVSSPSPTINPPFPHMLVLGFGVDSHQDYKVVRIAYHRKSEFNYMVPLDVEVYTLSLGFWRRIGNVGLRSCIPDFVWSQAFLNGVVHWVAYQSCGQGNGSTSFRSLIVGFGMDNETFSEIMLPSALAMELTMNLFIKTYRNSLAVINQREIDNKSCNIWVMQEYGVVESWTKMYSIDLVHGMVKVVGFRKNGDILVSMENKELAAYDPKTRDNKELGIKGSVRSFYADSFSETLALLERRTDIVAEESRRD